MVVDRFSYVVVHVADEHQSAKAIVFIVIDPIIYVGLRG
jgi:hypothetical protein